jgi:hypothetical protein
MIPRRFAAFLGGFLVFAFASADPADAQSSTRGIQYPPASSNRVIQSTQIPRGSTGRTTMQGSTTTQGSTTAGSNSRVVAPAKETFESKFWRYLNEARYREWAPVYGTSGDAYAGQSPHGAMLKMYLSRRAAGLPNELPTGSVIVKENYGPDGKTLMAITTMYRARNYDSSGTRWYWTKYKPDGSVATKDGKRLAGTVQGCIDCHADADGGDYAFFND